MDPARSQRAHRHAGVDEIVHALRGLGVMTRDGLARAVHADSWRTTDFGSALRAAEHEGRVRRLGDDLYELTEQERAFLDGAP
jgi:uncharacterized caspase-like protein